MNKKPPMFFNGDIQQVDGLKTEFGSWSDEALNGYVIMLETFASSSVSNPMQQRYQEKLNIARTEVNLRLSDREEASTVEFHGEVVMREELGSTYDHERTEHSEPGDPEDSE